MQERERLRLLVRLVPVFGLALILGLRHHQLVDLVQRVRFRLLLLRDLCLQLGYLYFQNLRVPCICLNSFCLHCFCLLDDLDLLGLQLSFRLTKWVRNVSLTLLMQILPKTSH